MAELATIARPYAEALFQAAGDGAEPLRAQLASLAALAADAGLRRFADDPQVKSAQVFDLIAGVAQQNGVSLDGKVANLLHALIENGRLSALPELATQFNALVNAEAGVSDATIQSAFPLSLIQIADTVEALEKRFGRKLNPTVTVVPELIGGVRVIVGDEVLDTSVKARLEQMRVALTA